MTVHLLKPALRIPDVAAFQSRQKQYHTFYKGENVFPVWTSRKPRRMAEMLDGGSVYWIVKNHIQCRQTILGMEEIPPEEEGGKVSYFIFCKPQLVRTQSIERRPFQGWRYLEGSSAPPDLGPVHGNDDQPPVALAQILRAAGLL